MFNFSIGVLLDSEVEVLEKDFDFGPILKKINESELRRDFQEFCRRMRIKWNFRNEPSENFSEFLSFKFKLT